MTVGEMAGHLGEYPVDEPLDDELAEPPRP
jgi:hypothetical protein